MSVSTKKTRLQLSELNRPYRDTANKKDKPCVVSPFSFSSFPCSIGLIEVNEWNELNDTAPFPIHTSGHVSLLTGYQRDSSQFANPPPSWHVSRRKKRRLHSLNELRTKEGYLTYRDSDSEKEVIRLISLLTNTTTVREIERGRESSPEQSRNR